MMMMLVLIRSCVPSSDNQAPLSEFASNLQQLLEHSPNHELKMSQVTPTYRDYFGWELTLRTYGFTKLRDLINAMPTNFQVGVLS